MKPSSLFLWVLYGVVASVTMTLADSYFGWGLFQ